MKTRFLLLVAALSWSARAADLPIVVVQPHAVALGFPAEAVVEAVQQATVAAQVPGRVVEVRADAGQRVNKGDVLLRIDAREAAEAVAAAQAQYLNAKASYERSRSLQQQRFVSQAAVDKAKADFDAAAASRAAAAVARTREFSASSAGTGRAPR